VSVVEEFRKLWEQKHIDATAFWLAVAEGIDERGEETEWELLQGLRTWPDGVAHGLRSFSSNMQKGRIPSQAVLTTTPGPTVTP